jgi:hypothetical protein
MQHEDRVGVNVVCGVVTELAIVYTNPVCDRSGLDRGR